MDGLLQRAFHMHVLAHVDEHAGHAGILADRHVVFVGDLVVLNDLIQDVPGHREGLAGAAGGDTVLDVLSQVTVGLDAQPANHVGDLCGLNDSHKLYRPLLHAADGVDDVAVAVDDIGHGAALPADALGRAGDVLGDGL